MAVISIIGVGAGGEGQYIAMDQTRPRQLVAEEKESL
jgi:hypothetical protein